MCVCHHCRRRRLHATYNNYISKVIITKFSIIFNSLQICLPMRMCMHNMHCILLFRWKIFIQFFTVFSLFFSLLTNFEYIKFACFCLLIDKKIYNNIRFFPLAIASVVCWLVFSSTNFFFIIFFSTSFISSIPFLFYFFLFCLTNILIFFTFLFFYNFFFCSHRNPYYSAWKQAS